MLAIILLLSSTKRSLAFIEPANICEANIVSFRSSSSSCEICSCSTPFSTFTSSGCQNLARKRVDNPFLSISNLDIQCPKPAQCASTEPNATTWYLGPSCPTCTCDPSGGTATAGVTTESRTEVQTWNGLTRCIATDCIPYTVSNLYSRCSSNNSTDPSLPQPLMNETKIIRVPKYDVSFFQPMWVAADESGDKNNRQKPYICLPCQLSWQTNTNPAQERVIRRPTYSSLFFVNGDGQSTTRQNPDPKCSFAYCEQVVSTRAQWVIQDNWKFKNLSFGIDPITNATINVNERVVEYCDEIGWEEWNHCKNNTDAWVLNANQCTGWASDQLLYDVCPRCTCAYSNLQVNQSVYKYYNKTSYQNNTKLTKYFCDLCTCKPHGTSYASSQDYMTCTRIAQDYAPFDCPRKTGAITTCNGVKCNIPSIENTCMIEEAVHWTDFNLYSTDIPTQKSSCAHAGLCDVFGVSNTGKCVSADININSEASGLQVWNCSNQHINDYRKPIAFQARLMCNNQTNNTVSFPTASDSCPVDTTYKNYLESVLKCAYTNQNNWLQDILQYVSCDIGTRWAFLNAPCGDPDITIFLNEFTRCMCNGLNLIVNEKSAGKTNAVRMSNVKLLNSYFDWKVRKLLDDMKIGGCSATLTCDTNSGTFQGKFMTNVLRFKGGFPVNESKINRTLAKEIIGRDLGGKSIDQISMSLLPTPLQKDRVQVPTNKTYRPFNYTSLFRIRVRYERKSDALRAMEWLKNNRNMTGNIAIKDSWSVLPLTHELSSPKTSGVVGYERLWGIGVLAVFLLLW